MTEPHVVIVGGGFGGLAAAKALKRAPVTVACLCRPSRARIGDAMCPGDNTAVAI